MILKNKNLKNIAKQTEKFTDSFQEGVGAVKEGFYSLSSIVDILKDIGKSIINLSKILFWLFKLFMYLFTEVINPFNLINDLFVGAKALPRVLINVVVRIIVSISKYTVNNVLQPIVQRLFGYDITHKNNENKDKKCYKTEKGKVPLSLIISTVLLPPLGVFMRFGLSKWMHIFIAGGLSILYYFPGLIYALILIYTN